ncbi:hypothetical protein [Pseudoduganella sp. OTU4001]|uniref:hypothetical protein n=1 Tax=Pseudoduganella sp. OTU4001 TaxID=3043854 RepID=UPI00313C1DAA
MDIEVRIAKLEVEVESLKEIARQNTQAIVRLEARMDQGFAEMRREMRWLLGVFLAGFATILGLMGRIAGLY